MPRIYGKLTNISNKSMKKVRAAIVGYGNIGHALSQSRHCRQLPILKLQVWYAVPVQKIVRKNLMLIR